jgi:hypothetical protein
MFENCLMAERLLTAQAGLGVAKSVNSELRQVGCLLQRTKRNPLIHFVLLHDIKTSEVHNSFFLIKINIRGLYLMQCYLSAAFILQKVYDSFHGLPCKHVPSNLLLLHAICVLARSLQGKEN